MLGELEPVAGAAEHGPQVAPLPLGALAGEVDHDGLAPRHRCGRRCRRRRRCRCRLRNEAEGVLHRRLLHLAQGLVAKADAQARGARVLVRGGRRAAGLKLEAQVKAASGVRSHGRGEHLEARGNEGPRRAADQPPAARAHVDREGVDAAAGCDAAHADEEPLGGAARGCRRHLAAEAKELAALEARPRRVGHDDGGESRQILGHDHRLRGVELDRGVRRHGVLPGARGEDEALDVLPVKGRALARAEAELRLELAEVVQGLVQDLSR